MSLGRSHYYPVFTCGKCKAEKAPHLSKVAGLVSDGVGRANGDPELSSAEAHLPLMALWVRALSLDFGSLT